MYTSDYRHKLCVTTFGLLCSSDVLGYNYSSYPDMQLHVGNVTCIVMIANTIIVNCGTVYISNTAGQCREGSVSLSTITSDYDWKCCRYL